MTRPSLLLALHAASAELRKAQEAALAAGDHGLASAIFDEGVRVLKLIGRVVVNREECVQ